MKLPAPDEQPILSENAEIFLRLLEDDFFCEIANHSIGSEHVVYPSAVAAKLAMLRFAYARGVKDARLDVLEDVRARIVANDDDPYPVVLALIAEAKPDFDKDIAAVDAANAANAKRNSAD